MGILGIVTTTERACRLGQGAGRTSLFDETHTYPQFQVHAIPDAIHNAGVIPPLVQSTQLSAIDLPRTLLQAICEYLREGPKTE
jgi:hypothetical protein